jgi:hypothetical protein
MPRIGDIQFVPDSDNTTHLLPLDAIPQDIRDEVEEAYAALKQTPGRLRVQFTDKSELTLFVKQVTSYCAQRPAEIGGPIRFRKSPTRGLPDTMMDHRITDVKEEAAPVETGTAPVTSGVTPAFVAPVAPPASRPLRAARK